MTENSLLFIPDISGFTEFVNETEISHSRHIISELLETIIEADTLGMRVSEIEGDAVVFFLQGRIPDLGEILDQARKTFEAFHSHLKLYERDCICPCGACQTAHRLSLKFVAHGGTIETLRVQEFEKPFGSDVILAHRLLKNDVQDNEYLLLTDGLPDATGGLPPWAKLVPGSSVYDSLGEISYRHVPLGSLKDGIPEHPARRKATKGTHSVSAAIHVPLPVAETFELISNLDLRLLWTRGVDELIYDRGRVNRAGTRHQCVVDGDIINFETVTDDPSPGRLVYGERILGTTPVLEPTLYYILEEDGEGTKLTAEFHYRPRPFPRSLFALPFRRIFKKQLPRSLAAIAKVAADGSDRPEPPIPPRKESQP
jgi:hypothetical protein